MRLACCHAAQRAVEGGRGSLREGDSGNLVMEVYWKTGFMLFTLYSLRVSESLQYQSTSIQVLKI